MILRSTHLKLHYKEDIGVSGDRTPYINILSVSF